MDITNCRSMELFKRLGIAEDLRDQGVSQDYSFDVLFSTGLSDGGELLGKWDLPSPNVWRSQISALNDGSMPREPYQRCSQAIFEAWLKQKIEKEPLIDLYFGLKFDNHVEIDSRIESTLIDTTDDSKHLVTSQYLVGCDGAGSRVRRCIRSELIGGPAPAAMYLVHFKSRDLSALQKQGQFWHIFFTSGSVIISQDEIDTWTIHLPISLDTDWKSIDPEKAIYQALGGSQSPYSIKVDEILVFSSWRPSIAISEHYNSESLRVFLSGDAAHQNIPTGGYGMNTAVGDSFDLGWKLSATLNGWGGKDLLRSYSIERKPVAIRNIERSGVHFQVHQNYVKWVAEAGPEPFSSVTESRNDLRDRIKNHISAHRGENTDHGIEMGYRYNGSPIVITNEEDTGKEPEWNYHGYVPSTWPGARSPHVYLKDGKTSIFDLYGDGFTIVDFTDDGFWANEFARVSTQLHIPLQTVHLPRDAHVRQIWGREAILVRPDDHVAWRASGTRDGVDVYHVLRTATGQSTEGPASHLTDTAIEGVKARGFTATVGNVKQAGIKQLAEFQK